MAATATAGRGSPSLTKAEEHMDRAVIAFFAMVVGMFMAILDIPIRLRSSPRSRRPVGRI